MPPVPKFVFQSEDARPIDNDEEFRLSVTIQSSRPHSPEWLAARNALVGRYLTYALAIASRYRRFDPSDCFQEAVLGLIRAAEKFNPNMGKKFSAYAYMWVIHFVFRSMHENRTITIPLHKTEDAIRHTERIGDIFSIGGDECEEGEIPDYRCDPIDAIDAGITLTPCWNYLNDRERRAIELKYGLRCERPLTDADIGRSIGVTESAVKKILPRSIAKMRAAFRTLDSEV